MKIVSTSPRSPFNFLALKTSIFLVLFGFLSTSLIAQSVWTDKGDYQPGETAYATGSGWAPFETVVLNIHEEPVVHADVVVNTTADANGAFTNVTIYNFDASDLGATFTLTATGQTSGNVSIANFTDAGGDYDDMDFEAGDPDLYPRVTYSQVMGSLPVGNANSTSFGFPIPGADHGTSVESLQPRNLGLGQVVPFLLEFTMDSGSSCANDCMTFVATWNTEMTNGTDFGFDPALGVIAAFVDSGDPFHTDTGATASVDSFSWQILNPSNEIEGTIKVCGVDPGDSLVVEMWVVLDSVLPAGGLNGNVQSALESAETSGTGTGVCAPGDTITTGNQTVPLNQVGRFTTEDVDISVSKVDNTDPVPYNTDYTYTLTVSNLSTTTVANSVVITDVLDSNTTYVSHSVNDTEGFITTCSESGGTLTCDAGFLNPGETFTIDVTVQATGTTANSGVAYEGVPCGGSEDLCNTVSITTITDDTDPTNDSDDEPTGVICTLSSSTTQVDVLCFGDSTGSIDLTLTDGTAPYVFAWTTGDGSGLVATDEDQSGLTAGTYNVTITDANNCSTTDSVTIIEALDLTCSVVEDSPVSVFGGSDGQATVTAVGGVGPYTYSWDISGETTVTATALSATTHTVTVTDANNCTTTCQVTINQPSNLSCTIVQDTAVVCNGESNGSATVTPTGGVSPYTYSWDISGELTQTAVALNVGTHTVTVTDDNGATTTCQVTITEPVLLECTAAQVSAVTINGASDGSATVTPTGGVSPYTYSWDISGELTQTAVALNVGTHTVTVTDDNGCTTTCQVTITEPDVLACTAAEVTAVVCNGESNGSATVTPTGGVSPYTYSWDISGELTQTAVALNVGTHTVTVTDDNGATTTCQVTITEPVLLECTAAQVSAVTINGASDGSATVTPTGGVSPYTYSWDISGELTQTAVALNVGTHTVTVTDDNGCTTTCQVTITEPDVLACTAAEVTAVVCNGESNGSATVTPTGGVSPYTYSWDISGELTQTAVALNVGTHTVTVTDDNGATTTCQVTITEPVLLECTAAQVSAVTINGASDGSATVTPTGGVSPYTYSWDISGELTQTAVALNVGTHTVTVTDDNGCTTTCQVTITEPDVLACTAAEVTAVVCNGESNGSATVTPTGGVSPYTYSWDISGELTQTAVALNVGTHTVTVTDDNGATTTCQVTITEPVLLECTAAQVSAVTINGASDGSATVTPTGGVSPYTYSWDISGELTQTAVALNVGTHTVTVTDDNGCTTTCQVTITEPDVLACTAAEVTAVVCNGESNGSATVTPTGGVSPYTYSWDISGELTQTAVALNVGTHTVTVTDDNGATTTCQVTITEPVLLECTAAQVSAVTINGASDGSATVTPTGGVSPYTYSWDISGELTQTAVALNVGTHTVTVTDDNGCTTTCQVTITEPDVLACTAAEVTAVVCNGESNGSATVTPTGGVSPYTYSWDISGELTQTAVALNVGTHTVTVTDDNGATTTCQVTITEPVLLECTAAQVSAVTINGASDGSATVTPTGGVSPYTYSWDISGELTQTAVALNVGTHTVTVTDDNGCTTTCQVTITEPDVLACTAAEVTAVVCNGESNGSATVTPTGGVSPYTYSWDISGELTQTAVALNVGTHTVTVTDDNGATTTCQVTITEPVLLECTAAQVSAVTINGASDGSATVTPTGGVSPYTYSWDISGELTQTAVALNVGTHTVTVTDDNGCTTTCQVTITEPDVLACTAAEVTAVVCNGESNGSATVTPTGGVSPYTYSWDISGELTQTAVALNVGTHTVTVTDDNGATTTCQVTITEPVLLECTAAQVSAVTINGASDGSATVTPTGGVSPYTYSWDISGELTQTAVALNVGTHTVTVTDDNGCTTTCQVTITEPDVLACTAAEVTAVVCNGESNGSATVTPTGGVSPYTYSWDISGELTQTAVALNVGTHTVTVTDDNGATTTCQVTITEPVLLECTAAQVSAVTINGASDGSATVTPTGGVSPYTYSWDISGELTQTAVALNVGTHTVTVTDDNGCTTTCQVTITEPDVLACTAAEVTAVVCNGESNGSATVTPTGGVSPYTYSWDISGELTQTAVALNVGTHTVTVTDDNGATTTCQVTITEPVLLECTAAQVSAVTINGASDGSATVTPTGGVSPYTYSWDISGELTQTAVALNVGTHTVTVTDDNGCTTTCQVTITEPDVLACTAAEVTAVVCNGESNGSATVTPTGGVSPYTYSWDISGELTQTAVALNVGTHTVTVTDDNGATTTCQVTITEPVLLECTAAQVSAVTINGASDGSATVTPTGGVSPYTYSWDISGELTQTAVALNVGTHTVTVTDDNGCTTTCQVTITEPDVLACTAAEVTAVVCNGESNGSATVTPTGGVSPYTYSWDISGELTQTAVALNVGTHTVTVTDANNATTTCQVTITEPVLLECTAAQVSAVTINGASDGSATVTPTGGVSPYTYSWDISGETTQTAVALNVGTHTVTVTDANLCTTTCQVTISEPDVLACTAVEVSAVVCNGESNGSATVTPTGGVSPYTYSWDISGETTQTAVALNAGTHTVTVTDANNATTTCQVTITEPDALTANAVETTPVVCNGESNGSATVTPGGGNGGYSYLWNDGDAQTTAIATGLAAGPYTVTVTDSKGCEITANVTITEPDLLVVTANASSLEVCAGDSVTLTGGGATSYSWDNGVTDGVAFVPTETTIYTVTGTDTNGCENTATVTVTVLENIVERECNVVGADNCRPDQMPYYNFYWFEDGSGDFLSDVNQTMTFTEYNNGTALIEGFTHKGNCVVELYIVLKNKKDWTTWSSSGGSLKVEGCSQVVQEDLSYYIIDGDKSFATVTGSDCEGEGTFKITHRPDPSPSPTYGVQVGPGAALFDSHIGADGVSGWAWMGPENDERKYKIDVNFILDCQEETECVIEYPNTLVCEIDPNILDVSSHGSNDGSATAIASGGATPYSYSWSNGETTAMAEALVAGENTVVITDVNGAKSYCSVTISEPDPDVDEYFCVSNPLTQEYRINGVWQSGADVINVNQGDQVMLSALPNGVDLIITLPDGSQVGDDYSLGNVSVAQSGIYTIESEFGCVITLEINIEDPNTNPCTTDPMDMEYIINGVSGSGSEDITIVEGDELILSIVQEGLDFTITLPDGTTEVGDYDLGNVTLAQSGVYTFESGLGCIKTLNISIVDEYFCVSNPLTQEYRINGVWQSGADVINVNQGDQVMLSALPNGVDLIITLPDGSQVGDDYSLGNVSVAQSGIYTIESEFGCVITLEINIEDPNTNPCTTDPMDMEYIINGVSGSGSEDITIVEGDELILSIVQEGLDFTITLPDGTTEVGDYDLGNVTLAQSGVYTFESGLGCIKTLNISIVDEYFCVSNPLTQEYRINGVWQSGADVINVNQGDQVMLSALPNGVDLTITLPDGTTVDGDYDLGNVSVAQSGIYTIESEFGCVITLDINIEDPNTNPCTTNPMDMEYIINGVSGSGSEDITIVEGDELILSIVQEGLDFTITLPDGTTEVGDYDLGNVTLAQSGVYTFESGLGCIKTLNISIVDEYFCVSNPLTQEYRINGVWQSGADVINVNQGDQVMLSALPNGVDLIITLPDGSQVGDDYSLGNCVVAQSGIYTIESEFGCVITLDINIEDPNTNPCTTNPMDLEYIINGVSGSSSEDITIVEGDELILSIVQEGLEFTITLPDGTTEVGDYDLGNVTLAQSGVYTFESGLGCIKTLNISIVDEYFCVSNPLTQEYRINGVWQSGADVINVTQGDQVMLSALPNGVDLTITLPDGSQVGDDYSLGNVSVAQSGIYTIESEFGCVITLEINIFYSVAKVGETKNTLSVIQELNESNLFLKVFPNPANTFIDVYGYKSSKIEIINVLGVTLKTIKDTESSKTRVNIDGIPNGVYLLRNTINGKVETKRLVIQQ